MMRVWQKLCDWWWGVSRVVRISVGFGEAFDRLSILKIKSCRLVGDKQALVGIEYDCLRQRLKIIGGVKGLVEFWQLYIVNSLLWEIEDALRLKEQAREFDEEFIDYARDVYRLNDRRAWLKCQIDDRCQSGVTEVKGYSNE